MLSRYICKLERLISQLTRINWLKCANCKHFKYKKYVDTNLGTKGKHFECTKFRKHTMSWQYCCYFHRRKKEDKIVKTKLNLNEAIRKHDRLMNIIYSKEDDIKSLKRKIGELDEEINYLKLNLGEE